MNDDAPGKKNGGWAGPILFVVVTAAIAVLFWWFLSA